MKKMQNKIIVKIKNVIANQMRIFSTVSDVSANSLGGEEATLPNRNRSDKSSIVKCDKISIASSVTNRQSMD
jgi:hypothetical protein